MKHHRRTGVVAPLAIGALLLTVTGCTEFSTRPGKHEISGALIGGAIGAGTGAIVGNQVGSPGAGLAIGAGLGALAGDVIGRGLDEVARSSERYASNHVRSYRFAEPAPHRAVHRRHRACHCVRCAKYDCSSAHHSTTQSSAQSYY